ncbi:MAG: FixH family protein [Nitrospiraceae bacterium]|nr:FixH family protein [Nitrospiraceae bacterium]
MKTALALVCILLYPVTALAGQGPQRHYKDSLFKVTDKGLFGVEIVVKGDRLKVGPNALDVIIHDKDDRDVAGAELTVTPWMPSMGHGVFEKPVVTERGGGVYSVGNVDLIMGGRWELKVLVKKDGAEDNATFDFPDVSAGDSHAATGAPADLDLSATRVSAKKLFKVSFASKLSPIVVDRMHSWELDVETPDGRPVNGADITIDGSMPQHGHGLPTEPAVTQELGGGKYLVGGMKFSMPGWWVVNFHIRAKDKEDTVTFNLLLK